MKKLFYLSALIYVLTLGLQSCNNGKTYAEMKEEEADAINKFILENDIKVISEKEFIENDTITAENEFVLFDKSGVYMNIQYRGDGEILKEGRYNISSRFIEICIKDVSDMQITAGDTLTSNRYSPYSENFLLTVGSSGSYSASFTDMAQSAMYEAYSTSAVPNGWLVPFAYLKMKSYISAAPSDKIARVRLIVPHSEGTSYATQYVYPCYYEITYDLN
ncbi:DUF4827 domain-containing protein [Bacteroides caecigallinarum]|uniref:DUF4827 domain-containing protein n=1 Tax=Bacteroides caecigallinarum TaxID=1411144 RepID=UPI001956EF8A|nr:DUF4827 domain-containing protein [Bacteroides caecigallinarum]MBM6863958.1 DUF4827 domain-containing protein [Bacteroides caecigallinarum]MBU3806876.1 DUF4827 domain-containing protein [Candidatus Phocaeicola faecipullorum]